MLLKQHDLQHSGTNVQLAGQSDNSGLPAICLIWEVETGMVL